MNNNAYMNNPLIKNMTMNMMMQQNTNLPNPANSFAKNEANKNRTFYFIGFFNSHPPN